LKLEFLHFHPLISDDFFFILLSLASFDLSYLLLPLLFKILGLHRLWPIALIGSGSLSDGSYCEQ
jgi:hypothetical protein